MKTTKPANAATSVLSLIAITAGAVSAALVIMMIGFFMTVISVGATPQNNMHAHNYFSGTAAAPGVMLANAETPQARSAEQQRPINEKGDFMDALLREARMDASNVSADGRVRPLTKARRIVANPMAMPFLPAKTKVFSA